MNKVIYPQLGPQVFNSTPSLFHCSLSTTHRGKHKMIKYMKPLQLFGETMKRTYYMPSAVFIGLNFTDEYASVAMSDDCHILATLCGIFPRDETLLDNLVESVQKFGYELEGIIVGGNNSDTPPVNIHNFMDDLCKKGKFESLKYTCWNDNMQSTHPGFECKHFRSSFPRMSLPVWYLEHIEEQERLEANSAERMLQVSLDLFRTLHMDKDIESEVEYSDSE